ncbi:LuxR family transcriptional regulator [Mesorhizobium retamae]|uniref:LuxR family transcriptional regulator n=1 Tax=Mesorhizobium retamae TaxID=2912854 RepID=A0ABS9QPD6_9HYPH|nr:LuxR family transcriptional regulator [Mesorhizobium sp. IRAMC:0171]MCG7509319.1 LuxR family transcriptional regulator [Mesorhizobium sp. IRAMC:0171]
MNDKHHDVFASAFEAIKRARDVAQAIVAIKDAYGVDHVTYHMAHMISGNYDQPFVRTTYPDSWVSRYLQHGYVKVDPVVQEGFVRQLPFEWREVTMTDAALVLMQDALAHGLAMNGYSVPIVDKVGRRALFSLNTSMADEDWTAFVSGEAEHLSELGHRLHRLAVFEVYGEHDPVPRIGPRERECLALAAQGKEYTVIAQLLDLSEHTVRAYLKSARLKLDCSNIPQAVGKAVKLRIISL